MGRFHKLNAANAIIATENLRLQEAIDATDAAAATSSGTAVTSAAVALAALPTSSVVTASPGTPVASAGPSSASSGPSAASAGPSAASARPSSASSGPSAASAGPSSASSRPSPPLTARYPQLLPPAVLPPDLTRRLPLPPPLPSPHLPRSPRRRLPPATCFEPQMPPSCTTPSTPWRRATLILPTSPLYAMCAPLLGTTLLLNHPSATCWTLTRSPATGRPNKRPLCASSNYSGSSARTRTLPPSATGTPYPLAPYPYPQRPSRPSPLCVLAGTPRLRPLPPPAATTVTTPRPARVTANPALPMAPDASAEEDRQVDVDFTGSDIEHDFPTVTVPRTAVCAIDDDVASPHASLAFHMAQLHLQDHAHTARNSTSAPALPHPESPTIPTAEEWQALRTLIRLVQSPPPPLQQP